MTMIKITLSDRDAHRADAVRDAVGRDDEIAYGFDVLPALKDGDSWIGR